MIIFEKKKLHLSVKDFSNIKTIPLKELDVLLLV